MSTKFAMSPPMTVLRLAGGLGNQLFQVMAGVLEALRSKRKLLVLTDALSNYEATRRPDVLRLVRSQEVLTAAEVHVPPAVRGLSLRARAGRWLPGAALNDRNFPHALGATSWAGGWRFLDGYFQRRWTQAMLDEALSAAQLDPAAMADPGNPPCDCVVHIRGGDFLHLPSHAIVDVDYYSRCLDLAKSEGCRSFGIVTDDRGHAEQILQSLAARHGDLSMFLMPDHGAALSDFGTLRAARARIIGNSTFAWWASACDTGQSPTWSPDRFVRDAVRDFALPSERIVPTLRPAAAAR
jgi:Glycosyl transferase family 11